MARVITTDALAHIRLDLEKIRRQRGVAFTAYLALFGLVVIGLILAPPRPEAMPRSLSWALALGGLLLSSALATSAAIGLPLWRARTMFVMTGTAGLLLGGALAFIVDWRAPITLGTKCLAYGAFVSAVAMMVLGGLTGQVWRRFPEPGWLLAISVAGVGLTALHFSCGAADAVHVYAFHLGPVLLAYALSRLALRRRETLLRQRNL